MLWISTKSKSWKTRKDVAEIIFQQNEAKGGGKKAKAEDQELKNKQKKEHQPSQDQGVGSPFCLYTAAPFPPPGRDCK